MRKPIVPFAVAAGMLALPMSAECAQDHWGLSPIGLLLAIDASAGTATVAASLFGGSPFGGIGGFDLGVDGRLFIVTPGSAPFSAVVLKVDPATLAQSYILSNSALLFGTGSAVDPSGTCLWRIGTSSFAQTPVRLERVDLATGIASDHGAYPKVLRDLAFDRFGRLFATTPGSPDPLLVEIDQQDAANSTIVGPMAGINGDSVLNLSSDRGSGMVTALTSTAGGLRRILVVDTDTAAVVPLGTLLPAAENDNAVQLAAADCPGQIISHGSGCPGSGGFVPLLGATGCPEASSLIEIEVAEGSGGSIALLYAGLAVASVPVGGGCVFHLANFAPAPLVLPLGGAGPGTGSAALAGVIPMMTAGTSISLQAWVIDPATTLGAAATRAVTLVLQ